MEMDKRKPPGPPKAKPPEAEPAPARDLRTRTIPDEKKPAWFKGSNVITALRASVLDAHPEYLLDPDKTSFTIGAAEDRDVCVPGGYLSGHHAIADRRGNALRITDQSSRHGCSFGGRQETSFDVRAGNTFECAAVRFVAFDAEMCAAYGVISDLVGAGGGKLSSITPSDVIIAAAGGGNILVLGPPNSGQDVLARTIHAVSLRRGQKLVEVSAGGLPGWPDLKQIIKRSDKSTLVIAVDKDDPVIDRTFLDMVVSRDFSIRLIILAPDEDKALRVAGISRVQAMQHIRLGALQDRPDEVLHLLDKLLAERKASFTTSDLSESNQLRLRSFAWRDNLAELRVASDRLIALYETNTFREAMVLSGVPRTTLQDWTVKLGLELPLRRASVDRAKK